MFGLKSHRERPVPVTPTDQVCGSCGEHEPLSSWFCENCGAQLRADVVRI